MPACLWQDVSSYGTYLNGRLLAKQERAVLRPGDSVTFCSAGLSTGLPALRLAPDASRAPRHALLVQHQAESEPELFPLLKPHTAVGRGLAADLRLDQAFISSRQCSIELRSPRDCAMEVTPAPPVAHRGHRSGGAHSSTAAAPLPPSVRPSVWLTDESRRPRLGRQPAPASNPNPGAEPRSRARTLPRFGTFVNGERAIGPVELRHGDQVGFGGEPPYPLLTLDLAPDLDLLAQIAGEFDPEIAEQGAPPGPAGEAARPAKRPRTPTKLPTKLAQTEDALLPSSACRAATVCRREPQPQPHPQPQPQEGVGAQVEEGMAAVAVEAEAAEAAEAAAEAATPSLRIPKAARGAWQPPASKRPAAAQVSASCRATDCPVSSRGTWPDVPLRWDLSSSPVACRPLQFRR